MSLNSWELVNAFFKKNDLVDHHIKSYNDFVNNRIQKVIDSSESIAFDMPIEPHNIKVRYNVRTGNVQIRKPYTNEADGSHSDIFPTEARLRNLTYSAHMFLEMALDSSLILSKINTNKFTLTLDETDGVDPNYVCDADFPIESIEAYNNDILVKLANETGDKLEIYQYINPNQSFNLMDDLNDDLSNDLNDDLDFESDFDSSVNFDSSMGSDNSVDNGKDIQNSMESEIESESSGLSDVELEEDSNNPAYWELKRKITLKPGDLFYSADDDSYYFFSESLGWKRLDLAELKSEMKIDIGESDFDFVYIGELPLMLKSDMCNLHGLNKEELVQHGEDPVDHGGYFIVNGSERVVVVREDLAPNKIMLEISQTPENFPKSPKYAGKVRGRKKKYFASVNSVKNALRSKAKIEFKDKPRKNDTFLRISFPYLQGGQIPLVILLRALGFHTEQEIISMISHEELFSWIVKDDLDVSTQKLSAIDSKFASISDAQRRVDEFDKYLFEELSLEERNEYLERLAIMFIGNRVAKGMTTDYRIKRAEEIIDKYLLPHIGESRANRKAKAIYLAEMAEKLLQLSHNQRDPNDKDHYANKRLKAAGDLMEELFRNVYGALIRDIKYQLERSFQRSKKPSIKQAVRSDVLTDGIKHAVATGNWIGQNAGVSQLLDRTSYMGTLSHLRRVVSSLGRDKGGRVDETRDLHPTQFGKICPNETPEGQNIGLVKNLALMCKISEGSDSQVIRDTIKSEFNFLIPITEMTPEDTKIYHNGELIGGINNGLEFTNSLRRMRRVGQISHELNITFYDSTKEIYIFNDSGRARRPLIIVEDGKPLLEESHLNELENGTLIWEDLITKGVVEYLDADEEENAYISMNINNLNEQHTHLEIDPFTMLGVCAGIIPFSNHNASPRNTMEAGMTKQALGLYVSNYSFRTDTRAHLLHQPQSPLVKTRISDATNYDKRPSGQNFIVAVMSFEGYNMEDSLILNKSSLERGLARSSFFRSYEASERRYFGGQKDEFEIPSKEVRGYRNEEKYKYLDDDGVINPESYVESGDVLIGKTSPPRFLQKKDKFGMPISSVRRESSVTVKNGERGIIDAVIATETVEGTKMVKVRVRDNRQPEFGDKFASRHGQKGVVGLILSQDDVPFTEEGVVPDLIINPHAIPSRMSIGQVLEMVAGKAGCLEGERVDGTPFNTELEDEVKQTLKDNGFESAGCESLYNGMTGERIGVEIFIGVAYYQRLHHMVTDKIYARSRGPVQVLTRQPTEGRAREGGLRFGEMEKDCLMAHGAASTIKERLLEGSDKYEAVVCSKCGMFAIEDKIHDKVYCPICGDVETFPVEIPYAFKLLLDELKSLLVFPKIELDDKI
ncbi:MAG: DNA-directed RNA polymerase subunit B [Methanobrevibacter sp.]|jgi:DNA-directed RNA polymerase subunit B|nr:DNA-directed RNA polymerase subunit B [Candidatus Methanoflexus mossambicus]